MIDERGERALVEEVVLGLQGGGFGRGEKGIGHWECLLGGSSSNNTELNSPQLSALNL